MSRDLARKHCVPFQGTETKLDEVEIAALMKTEGLGSSRRAISLRQHESRPRLSFDEDRSETSPHKKYSFPDIAAAMSFTNRLAAIAGEEKHFPDIHLIRNTVNVEFRTYEVNGLTENDFIMAAKSDEISR